jgi:diguanylate cyclase (GGDEF)-like protein
MENETIQQIAERRGRLLRPLHLVSLLTLVLLVLTGAILTTRYDAINRMHDERAIDNGFRQRLDEFAVSVVPQTSWDDAVSHVANRPDPAWMDRNIAAYLHSIGGIDHVFVIGSDDRSVLYAARGGVRSGLGAYVPFARQVRAMLPAIRQAEARRVLPVQPSSTAMVTTPIQQAGVAVIDDQPYMLVVSLVQPDFGTVRPAGPRAPVVVAARPVDAGVLSQFGSRYQLDGLGLSGVQPADDDLARISLQDATGRDALWLTWPDRAPGRALMRTLLPPLGTMIMLLSLVSWLFLRRSESIASELIASEARARHLAFHDTLTQLPNRAMMFDRLRIALASARRTKSALAVHCLDLDRFKEVNDTLGHQAGDELIRKVADMLTALCRETDTVARLGGDEFVIIQPDTNASGAAILAERVLKVLKDPIELAFGIVEIGVSIGTTLVANPETDANEALRQADLALYESKEGGRNRMTFFELEMDAAVRMRRALETDLRKALNESSLEMVYQPQIDHKGQVSGMEALLRWPHPERGMIAPAVFIPLAEESGLILDLGEFVFRRVFEETKGWKKRVAVNVSALQLRSPTFMSMLTQLVAEFRVDATNYEIEITETALLGDDGVTRNNIIMLKQEGFTIALDDFGTGYSSLSTLQKFEVDKIKIDRSFIRNLEADNEADALIDAIIQLGRALKLNIVAEGVETEGQRDRLMASGCNMYQGYLASRPVSAFEAAPMAV